MCSCSVGSGIQIRSIRFFDLNVKIFYRFLKENFNKAHERHYSAHFINPASFSCLINELDRICSFV